MDKQGLSRLQAQYILLRAAHRAALDAFSEATSKAVDDLGFSLDSLTDGQADQVVALPAVRTWATLESHIAEQRQQVEDQVVAVAIALAPPASREAMRSRASVTRYRQRMIDLTLALDADALPENAVLNL